MRYGIYYHDDYNYLQHLRDIKEIQERGIVESFRVGSSASQALLARFSTARLYNASESAELSIDQPRTGNQSNLPLPSMLWVVGPQLVFDWDIAAAMEDDFDYEDFDNWLDDDFMEMANADVVEEDREVI